MYIPSITSSVLFSLVILFPNLQKSEHNSDIWSVHEAGIIVSPTLMFSVLRSSQLISLGCLKGMQDQCFSYWKDIYAIAPGNADGRISGPKDPLQIF